MRQNIQNRNMLVAHVVWGFVIFCLIAVAGDAPLAAQEQRLSDKLFEFLENELDLSKGELKSAKEGRLVTKKLDTDVKQEVAMFGITRLNVSADTFLAEYGKDSFMIELAASGSWGFFSTPPVPEDVQELIVPSTDIDDLKKSNVGDSKVKGPLELLDAFRQLDDSIADYQQQADGIFQRELLRYAQSYMQQGNAGLIEYRDKQNPIKVADELQDILKQSPYLDTYMPELRPYLEQYPNSELPGASSQLFWKIENFGTKAKRPTISINHFVMYQPHEAEMIAASKQLYANHYYEAALGLTVMVKDPENPESGVYFMHISRSRVDALREYPKFMAGDLYKSAEELLDQKMALIKEQTEQ